jgi:hypothetical protein
MNLPAGYSSQEEYSVDPLFDAVIHLDQTEFPLQPAISEIATAALESVHGSAFAVLLEPRYPWRGGLVFVKEGRRRSNRSAIDDLASLEGRYRSVFSSPVTVNGATVGQVRLYFESTSYDRFWPSEATRSLGKQIGLLLAGSSGRKRDVLRKIS